MADWHLIPFERCGPIVLGASKAEVTKAVAGHAAFVHGTYVDDRLVAFTVDPDAVSRLVLDAFDLLSVDRLAAALHLASHSQDFGQAQGGSLYFLDLGIALLQFESEAREVVVFAKDHDMEEPLLAITRDDIAAYYHDQIA